MCRPILAAVLMDREYALKAYPLASSDPNS
jgi:hypothetical protein